MSLRFSASVAWEQARHIALVGTGGQRRSPSLDQGDEGTQFVTKITFKGPFPEAATFRIEIPEGLIDDSGRPLMNAHSFPLPVKTAEFPPLAKFAARFGIVEWGADPTLPVTLRNLEPEVRSHLLRLSGPEKDEPDGSSPPAAEHVSGTLWKLPPEQPGETLAWLRKVATAARDTSMFRNCSTGVQWGTHRRKRLLDRLKSGQALALAGIHDRAHCRKHVTPPVGAKPICDLPEDRAHANSLLAGVIRGGNGDILQKEKQVVLDVSIAFLQPSAVGVGGLERYTAVDTSPQIASVLIQGGGG
jgi:hypothetical protein